MCVGNNFNNGVEPRMFPYALYTQIDLRMFDILLVQLLAVSCLYGLCLHEKLLPSSKTCLAQHCIEQEIDSPGH